MTKHKRFKVIYKSTAIIVVLLVVFNYVHSLVMPFVVQSCKARVEALTISAINLSITSIINDGIEYSELINIVTDTDGKILALRAKSSKINLLARQISTLAQQNIEKFGKEQGVHLPLGVFLGSNAFAGYGPKIKIKVLPMGAVDCEYISEFYSVGINQTLHKLYINIVSEVELLIPTSASIETSTQILISECVLIGDVPDTYLNAKDMSDMFDLIP